MSQRSHSSAKHNQMTTLITVLYLRPTSGQIQFDEEYYHSTHMPLVSKDWGPHGLVSWEVVNLAKDQGSPYYYLATMRWKSVQAFNKAAKEYGTEIFADIPKYTNLETKILRGDLTGVWPKA